MTGNKKNITTTQGLKAGQKVKARYNRGTWHIFTRPRDKKCICGHTHTNDYKKNQAEKKVTISHVIKHPDNLGIGTVQQKALNHLKNRVTTSKK